MGLGTSEKRRKSGRVCFPGLEPLVAYELSCIISLSGVFAGRRTTANSCEFRLVAAKRAAVLIPSQNITKFIERRKDPVASRVLSFPAITYFVGCDSRS